MKKFTTLLAFACFSVGTVNAQDLILIEEIETQVEQEVVQPQSSDFWLDGRIQTDGQTFFGEPQGFDKLAGGVTLRRVQLGVNAQFGYWLYGKISVDFANGKFQLKDAFVRYESRLFDVTLGNFKEDFSVERTTSSLNMAFMERPMVVNAFAPGRHIGAQVNFQYDWFRTSVGLSWQAVDNAATADEVLAQNAAGFIQGSSFTHKVVLMPWASDPTKGLHLGFNWSYRTPNSAEWSAGTTIPKHFYYANQFSSRQNSAINRLTFLNTDTIYDVKYNMLYGAELGGYYKGFRFMGEFIWNNTYMTELALNKNTKFFYGYYFEASYMLFGGENRYDARRSQFGQPTRGRWWGDVELMARWDYLQLTDKKGQVYGGAGQNFTFGIIYHISDNLKAMLNYTYSRNDAFANGAGSLIVGYDELGQPTDKWLALSPTSIQGTRFHSVGCRVELRF